MSLSFFLSNMSFQNCHLPSKNLFLLYYGHCMPLLLITVELVSWSARIKRPPPLCLAHLSFRPCDLLPSLFVRRPSVNISHFNLLLRNYWANCNQTLVEWSLGGPLPKLCPVIPTSNQNGGQAKIRKRGKKF
jgi:hypothetical protein